MTIRLACAPPSPLDGRRRWVCSECGRIDVWGPGWEWFGAHSDRFGNEPAVEFVVCSPQCKKDHQP